MGRRSVLSLQESDTPTDPGVVERDRGGIEPLRIVVLARPFFHLLVILVPRVCQNLQQAFVSAEASAVFGWTRTGSADTTRIRGPRFLNQDAFVGDVVDPAVSEIVLVLED